jgi:hypothetical protein
MGRFNKTGKRQIRIERIMVGGQFLSAKLKEGVRESWVFEV